MGKKLETFSIEKFGTNSMIFFSTWKNLGFLNVNLFQPFKHSSYSVGVIFLVTCLVQYDLRWRTPLLLA